MASSRTQELLAQLSTGRIPNTNLLTSRGGMERLASAMPPPPTPGQDSLGDFARQRWEQSQSAAPEPQSGGGGFADKGWNVLGKGFSVAGSGLMAGLKGLTTGLRANVALDEMLYDISPTIAMNRPSISGVATSAGLLMGQRGVGGDNENTMLPDDRERTFDRSFWDKVNDVHYGTGQVWFDRSGGGFENYLERNPITFTRTDGTSVDLAGGAGRVFDSTIGFGGDIAYDPLVGLGGGANVGVRGGQVAAGRAGRVGTAVRAFLAGAGDNEIAQIATRGGAAVTGARRAELGLGERGLRLWGARLPGTAAIDRAVSVPFNRVRTSVSTSRWFNHAKNPFARTPQGLEEAYRVLQTGRPGAMIRTPSQAAMQIALHNRLGANASRWAAPFAERVLNMFDGMDAAERIALREASESSTERTVLNEFFDDVYEATSQAGVRVPDKRANYVTHYPREGAWEELQGMDPLKRAFADYFEIRLDDTPSFAMQRKFGPGKHEFEVQGNKVVLNFGDGSTRAVNAEIERVLKIKDFLVVDPAEVVQRYLRDVSSTVGLVRSWNQIQAARPDLLGRLDDMSFYDLQTLGDAVASDAQRKVLKDAQADLLQQAKEMEIAAREVAANVRRELADSVSLDAQRAGLESGALQTRIRNLDAAADNYQAEKARIIAEVDDVRTAIEAKAAKVQADLAGTEATIKKLEKDIAKKQGEVGSEKAARELKRARSEKLNLLREARDLRATLREHAPRYKRAAEAVRNYTERLEALEAAKNDPEEIGKIALAIHEQLYGSAPSRVALGDGQLVPVFDYADMRKANVARREVEGLEARWLSDPDFSYNAANQRVNELTEAVDSASRAEMDALARMDKARELASESPRAVRGAVEGALRADKRKAADEFLNMTEVMRDINDAFSDLSTSKFVLGLNMDESALAREEMLLKLQTEIDDLAHAKLMLQNPGIKARRTGGELDRGAAFYPPTKNAKDWIARREEIGAWVDEAIANRLAEREAVNREYLETLAELAELRNTSSRKLKQYGAYKADVSARRTAAWEKLQEADRQLADVLELLPAADKEYWSAYTALMDVRQARVRAEAVLARFEQGLDSLPARRSMSEAQLVAARARLRRVEQKIAEGRGASYFRRVKRGQARYDSREAVRVENVPGGRLTITEGPSSRDPFVAGEAVTIRSEAEIEDELARLPERLSRLQELGGEANDAVNKVKLWGGLKSGSDIADAKKVTDSALNVAPPELRDEFLSIRATIDGRPVVTPEQSAERAMLQARIDRIRRAVDRRKARIRQMYGQRNASNQWEAPARILERLSAEQQVTLASQLGFIESAELRVAQLEDRMAGILSASVNVAPERAIVRPETLYRASLVGEVIMRHEAALNAGLKSTDALVAQITESVLKKDWDAATKKVASFDWIDDAAGLEITRGAELEKALKKAKTPEEAAKIRSGFRFRANQEAAIINAKAQRARKSVETYVSDRLYDSIENLHRLQQKKNSLDYALKKMGGSSKALANQFDMFDSVAGRNIALSNQQVENYLNLSAKQQSGKVFAPKHADGSFLPIVQADGSFVGIEYHLVDSMRMLQDDMLTGMRIEMVDGVPVVMPKDGFAADTVRGNKLGWSLDGMAASDLDADRVVLSSMIRETQDQLRLEQELLELEIRSLLRPQESRPLVRGQRRVEGAKTRGQVMGGKVGDDVTVMVTDVVQSLSRLTREGRVGREYNVGEHVDRLMQLLDIEKNGSGRILALARSQQADAVAKQRTISRMLSDLRTDDWGDWRRILGYVDGGPTITARALAGDQRLVEMAKGAVDSEIASVRADRAVAADRMLRSSGELAGASRRTGQIRERLPNVETPDEIIARKTAELEAANKSVDRLTREGVGVYDALSRLDAAEAKRLGQIDAAITITRAQKAVVEGGVKELKATAAAAASQAKKIRATAERVARSKGKGVVALDDVVAETEALIRAVGSDPDLSMALTMHADYLDRLAAREDALASAEYFGRTLEAATAMGDDFVKVTQQVMKDGFEILGENISADGGMIVAQDMATALSRIQTSLDNGELVQWLEDLNRIWKGWATATPGFHIRNGMSASFMNFSDGVTLADHRAGYSMWRKYLDDAKWLDSQPADVQEAFLATFASGSGSYDVAEIGAAARGATATNRQKAIRAAQGAGLTNWSRKKGSNLVEGPMRLSVALNTMRNGGSYDQALGRINRLHFDYGELSKFDKKAKLMIPFYIFMSRNIPLQITQMLTRPTAYATYAKFVNNFSDTQSFDIIPEWLLRKGAFVIGRDVGGPFQGNDLVMSPDLPFTNMIEDVSKYTNIKSALSDVTPFVRVPIEAGLMGESAFMGQELSTPEQILKYAGKEFFPPVGTTQRVGGIGERYENRQASSIANFFGVPIRELTPEAVQAELRRRSREG